MNLLSLLKRPKENPFFAKLKKLLPPDFNVNNLHEAFYVGGFVYTDECSEVVKKVILENKLERFLKTVSYDSQKDNIELYLVVNKNFIKKILVILDPVELYHRESVLTIIPIDVNFIMPSSSEKIFSDAVT